jgi:hypothetical protein
MCVGHHSHPLGLRHGAALEFLSNSRGRRNARARGEPNLTNWPAFVFCENSARFCQCNQQYLKPVFA